MARGWESKSVEQQQEEMAEQRKSFREKTGSLISPTPPPKEQQRNRKREGLLLSRGRLTQELQAASHLRHRQMLEQAIVELDRQLSSFEQVADTKSRK
jgi:hypothetical protein